MENALIFGVPILLIVRRFIYALVVKEHELDRFMRNERGPLLGDILLTYRLHKLRLTVNQETGWLYVAYTAVFCVAAASRGAWIWSIIMLFCSACYYKEAWKWRVRRKQYCLDMGGIEEELDDDE